MTDIELELQITRNNVFLFSNKLNRGVVKRFNNDKQVNSGLELGKEFGLIYQPGKITLL